MKITKRKIKSADLLFCIAYCILFFCSFYGTTTFIGIFQLGAIQVFARVIAMFFITWKILVSDRVRFTTLVAMLMVLILSIAAYLSSDKGLLLDFSILLLGSKSINTKRLIRLYLILGTIMLTIAAICSLFGLIENYSSFRSGSNQPRFSFGIVYSTDFAAHIFYLLLAYDYIRQRRLKLADFIMRIVLIIFLNAYCDARFSEVMILLELIIFWLYEQKRDWFNKKFFRILATIIAPICGAITIALTLMYSSTNLIMVMFNELMSKRLSVANSVISTYGIKLFGQAIRMQGQGYKVNGFDSEIGITYLDSSYVQILVLYGIVFFAMFMIAYFVFTRRTIKLSETKLTVILMVIALTGIYNQYFIHIAYNPFTIIMGTYIFGGQADYLTVKNGDINFIPQSHNEEL